MNWTDDEVDSAEDARAMAEGACSDDADKWRAGVAAIMTRAVELVAARGGTMTTEALERVDELLERSPGMWGPERVTDLRQHITTQGATVATLQANSQETEEHYASLLTELGRLPKSEQEQIAELRRLRTARAAMEAERDTLQANVAELETAHDRTRQFLLDKEDECKALHAEVERLKAESTQTKQAAVLARSDADMWHKQFVAYQANAERLEAEVGAIHTATFTGMDEPTTTEEGGRVVAEIHLMRRRAAELGDLARKYKNGRTEARTRAETAESRLAAIRERGMNEPELLKRANRMTYWNLIQWVLEGDAPQEGREPPCPTHPTGGACEPSNADPTRCMHGFHSPQVAPRGPSSRVVAELRARGLTRDAGFRYPCPPTCKHDDAANLGHPDREKEKSTAVTADLNRVAERSADWAMGYNDGHDIGAEKMRAAFLEVVTNYMRSSFGGMPPALKAAIEGAAP